VSIGGSTLEDHPGIKRLQWIVSAVLLLALAGCLVGVARFHREMGAGSPAAAHWAEAQRVLDAHAAALVRGDEAGWLAAVDPARADLVDRYRKLYATLRTLQVTGWIYHSEEPPHPVLGAARDALTAHVQIIVCFQGTFCPGWDVAEVRETVPFVQQDVDLERNAAGSYVIVGQRYPIGEPEPPWAQADLSFVKGRRVTVGASGRMAERLAAAAPVADRAAEAADWYAGRTGTKINGYRVFLADDEEWQTWYGGQWSDYAGGYAVPTSGSDMDVVVKASELASDDDLAALLRHEFGHVVTLTGVLDTSPDDQWLAEGVAEHIAHSSELADRTDSGEVVRSLRVLPSSIALETLPEDASAERATEFYAIAHTGVSCLAQRYGDDKLLAFVRAVFVEHRAYDAASTTAFGKPWATVDKDCVGYIRQVARS
jgi:hypothetical protein